MRTIDATHDRNLKSWVDSAEATDTDFPIQNLPYCRFRDGRGMALGVGIGDKILNLEVCADAGLLGEWNAVAKAGDLRGIMAMSVGARNALRGRISQLLSERCDELSGNAAVAEAALVDQAAVSMEVPCEIRDYTDFYASIYHATNVGSMFRPDNPILPNYRHIPIGYHGRASSIVASGVDVRRPVGQQAPAEEGGGPQFGPCKLLDYELEVGFFVADGNDLGETIGIGEAEDSIFGMCLVNDWSARDIQKWEYQPLGPFLAKSFATTISPWVVTLEALAPYRCAAFERPEGDPQPLPYLTNPKNAASGGVDLTLEVALATQKMRDEKMAPQRLSRGSFRDMYWTIAQMLTHHSSAGCNMSPGDLLASGTVSGQARDARGCLLELTWDGEIGKPVPGTQRTPLKMPTGEERKFLADGDEIVITGFCEADGFRRIGFGECRGIIRPPRSA